MVSFFLQGKDPCINIVHVDGGDKEEDPFEHIMYSQICNLTENEQANLYAIPPPMNVIIGVPYVTRLTKTNTKTREMVISLNV
jgi:hypothetical protein